MPSELIPRAYQEEIFNRARHENIIAALDTGSGKTYIAVLLIRWLATQNLGARKIFVFIVPRVPLVEQQKDFIAGQIPLTVRGYYGALVDPWQHDPVRWAQEFNECDVMVMTAQVFLDAMLHAHWSMEQVALLVFDEAHHARKNNPYNQILHDFYLTCDPRHRPKVFGMTASPVWNPKNPRASLQDLEHNMRAKVIGVQENKDELLEHSPRPNEIIREYPAGSMGYPDYPLSLWDQLVSLELHTHPIVVDFEVRYAVTRMEVGPYAADFYLSSHLRALVSDLVRKHQYDYLVTQDKLATMTRSSQDDSQEDMDAMSVDSDATELSTRLIQMEAVLEKFGQLVSFNESSVVDPEWISPKLRVLVSILLERRSSAFQGIVFVEQRQVAATLAWILPRIPELQGWITSGALIGHGIGRGTTTHSGTQGMVDKKQQEVLKSFKSGACNLLISTSVGEEGLDFQACDLIVRFDQLQNMVGYLQSRGRARRFDSTYIVMVPEGSHEERTRYNAMRKSEPEIKRLYQYRHVPESSEMVDVEEPDDPADIAARQRYEIPSTGAVLTFGSAISLLNYLCALVPRDKYTKVLQPQYEGIFQSTVVLPSALPIPRDSLLYHGAHRRTKREAKAAAAYAACKALHQLGVFDDYLLPTRKTSGAVIEDADGRLIPEVGHVSDMMNVLVYDPWSSWHSPGDEKLMKFDAWVYPMLHVGQTEVKVGLVTANALDLLPIVPCGEGHIQFGAPQQIFSPSGYELQLLREYTTLGIHWCNTSKLIKTPLTCLLALLKSDGHLDFESMQQAVQKPTLRDLTDITHEDEGRLLILSKLEYGRPLLLRRLRDDLNPLSRPSLLDGAGSEGEFDTYVALFESLHGNGKYPISIPREGPLLLLESFPRNFDSQYSLHADADMELEIETGPPNLKRRQRLVPAGLCEKFVLPEHVLIAFRFLPQVIRRVTDVYRARMAVEKLGLPALQEDLVVEALTLPCATAGFNNQRLETLGDSVLKLSVVVHLYNKYPFRHEGQLDGMRKNSVSNRVLLARAKDIGLERFLTCEPSAVKKWRPTSGDGVYVDEVWYAERKFARRSLQDCMEALLGVSFLSGGINMALQAGTALQLCFGGTEPWGARYTLQDPKPVPPLFKKNFQEDLGYEFKSGQLLMEAVTHPSFQSDNACYQRLEFLGDALLDLVVMEYLFRKFPTATSGQLSWARSKAVCAPALTTIAVKRLSLDKYILANNFELGRAMAKAVPVHRDMSYEHIVLEGWKYDPPKALSDVMESVCGAMLVDSGYDYERTKTIVEKVMEPLLDVLGPDLPRDPTSELMLHLARKGCRRARFERFGSEPEKKQNDTVRFIVHDVTIGAPLRSAVGGLTRAKPLLAQMAKKQLEDCDSEFYLERLCNCRATKSAGGISLDEDIDREDLDDEKEEEFAVLGVLELREADGVLEVMTDDEEEEQDAAELERMLTDGAVSIA